MNRVLWLIIVLFLAICTCTCGRIPPVPFFSSRVRLRLDLSSLSLQSNNVDIHTDNPLLTDISKKNTAALQTTTTTEENSLVNDAEKSSVQRLQETHSTLLSVAVPAYPQCEVVLCGTVHVLDSSAAMVREVVRALRPACVIVELCADRVDALQSVHSDSPPLSLWTALFSAWRERSVKALVVNLLLWMQSAAAQVFGGKLGADLSTAAIEAHRASALLVLGDRDYAVTVQRVMDKLSLREKIKCVLTTICDVVMLRCATLWDKLLRRDRSRAHEEIEKMDTEEFVHHFPALAEVVIHERDQYLAQSILTTCDYLCRYHSHSRKEKHRIVVVVGQGHLQGIQQQLLKGSIGEERLREISSSSRHPCTWPEGMGVVFVHTEKVFGPLHSQKETDTPN